MPIGWQGPPLKMGQFGYTHFKNDTKRNYTCDPSMSNHFNPSTTTLRKVKPLTHIK
jgi:hypothetical protein